MAIPAKKSSGRERNGPSAASSTRSWGIAFLILLAPQGALAVPEARAPRPPNYSGAPAGQAIVASAQRYLGMPYVWGGQGRNGFDCSGLIEKVFLQHGYALPRVSRQQALVGLLAGQPFVAGDLLFFAETPGSHHITHVALSMGGTRFIHAALGKGHVTYDHLGERYYADRLVVARRPLALPPGRYATPAGLAMAHAAFANDAELNAFLVGGGGDPNRAAAGAAKNAAPSPDMVVEHADELPNALARADSVSKRSESFADPFGELLFLPEETGFGLRLGGLVAPTERAALAAIDGRYFGHASGLKVDVAFPLALHLARRDGELEGDAGAGGTVRQWGRLLRQVELGQPDAKVYASLSRVDAITLGQGTLVRHLLPNGANYGLGDALLRANALTLQLGLQVHGVRLQAAVDDVLAPHVTGLAIEVGRPGEDARWRFGAEWATDWRAPYAGDLGGQDPGTLGARAVHGLSVGPSLRLGAGHGISVRGYAKLAALMPRARPLGVGLGGHLGVVANFAGEQQGALGPVLTIRLEGRLHSAAYRPSYFSFAYAARRLSAAPPLPAEPGPGEPALDLLMAQRGQPPEASVLAEAIAALGGRLTFGVSYEDGGPLRHRRPGPDFVARSLTAFVAMTGLPLAGGTRLLRLHALWHTSERPALWPPVGRELPGSFGQASARADLFDWLDLGAAIRKPLGPRGASPGFSLVADAAVHFAF